MTPQTRDALEVTLTVPPELRERYRFAPGQFLTLETDIDGERVRRSYSICASPAEEELRVAIKRVPDGAFSRWAHTTLRPGMEILVGPPEGRFGVAQDPSNARHYVAFAAGSGITPVLSIVRHVLETERSSRVTLVYGNRGSASVMFREALQALKDRYLDRLALAFVMSREPQDLELFAGRIDRAKVDALLAGWIDPAGIDVAFICGPQAMSEAVSAALEANGVPKDRIRTELFAAGERARRTVRTADPDDAGAGVHASVVLDGREYAFTIEDGRETVLDAGLRAGVELPYSCKGGVCSTCRAMLVEGDVEMDVHYALEDYEIARGLILMCQSYPVTPAVRIDVDAGANG